MKEPIINNWLTQDEATCAVHSRIMLLQYLTKEKIDVQKVFRLMKEKNKTIHKLLADGDLGWKVKEVSKTFKDTASFIDDLRRGLVADITMFDKINYNAQKINFQDDFGNGIGGHAVMFKGYTASNAMTYMANTWGEDRLQLFSLALLTASLRRYFIFDKIEKVSVLNPITPLKQTDKRWRNYRLGKSRLTVGSHGCLITSICMAMERLRGYGANPGDASKYWVFSKSGYLQWAKTEFRGIDYKGKANYSVSNVWEWTSNERACIIKVKAIGIPEHFVLADKVLNGEDVRIIDPLDGKVKLLRGSGYYTLGLRLLEKEK